MQSGVLLIDKGAGLSSAHVVARVKRALKADKVGHAGTLDPDATGLLVCLINGATRVASAAVAGMKSYEGILRLGVRTSTDDMSGKILSEELSLPEPGAILESLDRFRGPISQIPPRVSAVQIGGERAYDMERRGQEFQLEPRQVEVFHFELTHLEGGRYAYVVVCSPGTYIRSLARDLGELHGCGGAVETIRRTQSGPLNVEHALSLDDVSWDRLRDWSILFPNVPRLVLDPATALGLVGGKEAALRSVAASISHGERSAKPGDLLLYTGPDSGETWGLLRWEDGQRLSFVTNVIREPYARSLLGM